MKQKELLQFGYDGNVATICEELKGLGKSFAGYHMNKEKFLPVSDYMEAKCFCVTIYEQVIVIDFTA